MGSLFEETNHHPLKELIRLEIWVRRAMKVMYTAKMQQMVMLTWSRRSALRSVTIAGTHHGRCGDAAGTDDNTGKDDAGPHFFDDLPE